MSENDDKDFRDWFKFRFPFFKNHHPFTGFREQLFGQDMRENIRTITDWIQEFTTDFVFPNIEDEGEELIVTVNTPGIPKSDLQIKTDTTSITVYINKDGREIKRKVRLPSKIIPNKSYSTYKNGQLKVHLTKENKEEEISIE